MKSINIYVLMHNKPIEEEYDEELYKPLICGSEKLEKTGKYLRDDTGDNISSLNRYYSELTGEYWAWKHSKSDIIGFCHYRRWFVKNFTYKKLDKETILSDLEDYDIILPRKNKLRFPFFKHVKNWNETNPEYGVKLEDYAKLKEFIKINFPEYYPSFKEYWVEKAVYSNNMFICNKELADEYFNWLFNVLDGFKNEIDFSEYASSNQRIFGFMSENLLSIYVKHHKLKIKEYPYYFTNHPYPYLRLLLRRFPTFEYYFFKYSTKLLRLIK